MSFVVATTAAARDQGLAAGKLVPAFAPAVGGRGAASRIWPRAAAPTRRASRPRWTRCAGRSRRNGVSDRGTRGAADVGWGWTSARCGSASRCPTRRSARHAAGYRGPRRGGRHGPRDIAALVAEHEVVGVVVGLPRTLAGREGAAAGPRGRTPRRWPPPGRAECPVELADERLTTVVATRDARERPDGPPTAGRRRPGCRRGNPAGLARRAALIRIGCRGASAVSCGGYAPAL